MNVALLCSCVAILGLTGEIVGENIQEYICNQRFRGYKIDYARRRCTKGQAVGCVNPFPYNTKHQCLSDFRGKGSVCEISKPCRNGGMCMAVMTKKGRTFRCDCYETGFYGRRCHKRCPKVLTGQSKQTACILIG